MLVPSMLDKNVRSVMFQFHTKNLNMLCSSLRWVDNKPFGEGSGETNGTLIIPPTEKCYILAFLTILEDQFVLVDAFKKKRIFNYHDNVAYIMRYVFTKKELATTSAISLNNDVRRDLHRLCAENMWRIQVHNNPYKCPEEHVVSVNLKSKETLYHPDGQSVMIKSGTDKVPLQPQHTLLITNGKIEII